MSYFSTLHDMDPIHSAPPHRTFSEALAAGAYLGYINQCEEEYLLDKVIEAIPHSANLYEACIAAGVDPSSLDDDDMRYIKERT